MIDNGIYMSEKITNVWRHDMLEAGITCVRGPQNFLLWELTTEVLTLYNLCINVLTMVWHLAIVCLYPVLHSKITDALVSQQHFLHSIASILTDICGEVVICDSMRIGLNLWKSHLWRSGKDGIDCVGTNGWQKWENSICANDINVWAGNRKYLRGWKKTF